MINRNEYEYLKKQGYTEEEIRVVLDALSQLSIVTEPLAERRDDRSVIATDSSGVEKRTSSIMMGYNKQNIQLENGEYISYEDFKAALNNELSKDGDDVVYVCKKTGKKVESSKICEEMLSQITAEMSTFELSETNKVTNQTTARIRINEPNLNKTFSKGILMLGNVGIDLPNGEYVHAEEIAKALNDYVKLKPKQTPPVIPIIDHYEIIGDPKKTDPEIDEDDEIIDNVIFTVIQRYQNYIPKKVLAAICATLLIISMLKITDAEIIKKIEENGVRAPYGIEQVADSSMLEDYKKGYVELSTGEKVYLPDGMKFYGSSDHEYGGNNSMGIIGQGLREQGEYTAEYFSFLHNGKILGVERELNKDLQESKEKIAKENNVPLNEIETHVHFGGPTCGWVNLDDVMNNLPANDVNMEVEGAHYDGVAENFNGSTITFQTENGNVTINVVDENGSLLEKGSVVKGSDGNEYKIDSLSLEEYATSNYDVTTEKKLTFGLNNISLNDVIITGLATALAALLLRKKKKVMTEMTEEQIIELIEEARDEFLEDSEFEKAVRTIIGNKELGDKSSIDVLKEALIAQETTVEDIRNIGGVSK